MHDGGIQGVMNHGIMDNYRVRVTHYLRNTALLSFRYYRDIRYHVTL